VSGVLDFAALDETHDAAARSWVVSANADTDFPLQNLPFAIFTTDGTPDRPRAGVALGDQIVDLVRLQDVLQGPALAACRAADADTLNALMALGNDAAGALRQALFRLYREGAQQPAHADCRAALLPLDAVTLHRPVAVAGFTDFFASVHHATNAGRLFRPDAPLLPNYKYVPVGYNGWAASVQVDNVVCRPRGQTKAADAAAPAYLPSAKLDYEVELGIYIGVPSARHAPVPVAEAWRHVFGMSLLNDWSARDIQAWEYQPLGPFLAKSFATSVSPWVVTTAALAPFRTAVVKRPAGDPAPLPHLADEGDQRYGGLAIQVEAWLSTEAMRGRAARAQQVSRASAADLYWTVGQLLAHHTSNGSWLENGDLLGTGTISGASPNALGSLLELTRNGQEPLSLGDADRRTFLEDGDEVVLRGRCERAGFIPIGFGECRAVVLAA
jgi:fumarylacetoacetase